MRGLRENMIRSWRGMEDAHRKIAKHFLLDICMHQSYPIQRLSYLYNGYIYIYIHRYLDIFVIDIYGDIIFMIDTHIYIYTYIYIYFMSRTGTRKERPGERGPTRWLQSGPTEACSVGTLCIWQVKC